MNCNPEEISWKNSAQHLSPREFHDLYVRTLTSSSSSSHESSTNTPPSASAVILDVRNHYESAVGRFEQAIRMPTRTFSEFPKVADQLIEDLDLRNKKHVLLYCTGGIRCERASAYLQSKGVTSCYQLRGGIHRYCEEIGDRDSFFRGRNFVFDRRLTTRRVGMEDHRVQA